MIKNRIELAMGSYGKENSSHQNTEIAEHISIITITLPTHIRFE
jgi:hypothetical protein